MTTQARINEKSSDVGAGLSLLEQVAERSVATKITPLNRMREASQKRCRNPKAPILFGYSKTKDAALVHKAQCKMWNCPACGARKAQKAVALCINHINAVGGDWFFMTITAHKNWRGSEASLKNLRKNWHKLRKRMREENGGHFDYFRTYEMHKDGSWHMHFITNCKLPYTTKTNKNGDLNHYSSWLKRNAAESGLGFMADYQPLENAGFAAHYVAKYMAKSMDDKGEWVKGMQRYRTSDGWTKLDDLTEASDFDWQYIKNLGHLWFEFYNAKDAGMEVYLSTHNQKVNMKQLEKFFGNVRQQPTRYGSGIYGTVEQYE